jgi:predicted nucleotide-binding protein
MTTLRVPREQVKTVLLERIQAGEELATTQADIAEKAAGWRDWLYLFATWREHTIAELKAVYESEDEPQTFDAVSQTVDHSSPRYTFPYSKAVLTTSLWALGSLVERLPLAVEPEALQTRSGDDQTPRERGASPGGRKVFVVHGRTAGGFREAAARFVEHLGLTAVILAEQAIEGRTVIESFEANTIDVGFAIVLLTPEDRAYGQDDEAPPRPNRARQNVILEIGYFMAKLGRKNVVALVQEGVELPTDILGILYIPLDDGGAWKTLLARELQAAGYDLDLTKLLN